MAKKTQEQLLESLVKVGKENNDVMQGLSKILETFIIGQSHTTKAIKELETSVEASVHATLKGTKGVVEAMKDIEMKTKEPVIVNLAALIKHITESIKIPAPIEGKKGVDAKPPTDRELLPLIRKVVSESKKELKGDMPSAREIEQMVMSVFKKMEDKIKGKDGAPAKNLTGKDIVKMLEALEEEDKLSFDELKDAPIFRSTSQSVQLWQAEAPVGTVNGTNKIFTLTNIPDEKSLELTVNGQTMREGTDFTVTGRTITFTTAPRAGVTWGRYQVTV